MEDQTKYSTRASYDGKTELLRIYYNPREISFELFLWLEYTAINKAIMEGLHTFKAFSSRNIGPFMVSKN